MTQVPTTSVGLEARMGGKPEEGACTKQSDRRVIERVVKKMTRWGSDHPPWSRL
eukprot:COSAG05_NODE_895_length_6700_cov_14.354189_10_plen_54_part_00